MFVSSSESGRCHFLFVADWERGGKVFWERGTGLGDEPRPEPRLKGGTMVVLSSVSIVCCLMFHKYVLHPPWSPTRERNMEMALLFPTLKLHIYYTPVHTFQLFIRPEAILTLVHMPQD